MVLVVMGLAACDPGGAATEAPRTLRGSVSANVARARIITVSGETRIASVSGGSFELALPEEPYVLVLDGTDLRPMANLVAPTGDGGRTPFFPGVTFATRARVEGLAVESLVVGDALVLGTITVTATVTVIAEHNILEDLDSDGDGETDFADEDDDGDGTADEDEEHLLDPDGDGEISILDGDDDGDGEGDDTDADDDGDGVLDLEELDSDFDGIVDAEDPDDDNDGILDGSESTDVTPDDLIGAWYGTTETELTIGVIEMDELFELAADGSLTGDFEGTDETTGCTVAYELTGTWEDDADGASDLLVGWDVIELTVSGCIDPGENVATIDVVEEEGDLWDDELEGIWEVGDGSLIIYTDAGEVIEYSDTEPGTDGELHPDALLGVWNGTSTLDLGGGSVELDEVFTFGEDGTISGDFTGVEADTGCTIDYVLAGTWEDDEDGVADLLVGWTSVTFAASGCDDEADDVATTDVTAEEGDLWDDELEGTWTVTDTTLTIETDVGTYEYTR